MSVLTKQQRIMEVLPKRFVKYGLALHPDKTRLIPFRRPPRKASGGEDHGRTVHVGEGEIVNGKHVAARGGRFPLVGTPGSQHLEALAKLAWRGAPKALFIAVPAVGLAEHFAEAAVGKGDIGSI
jgi:hypothetical protein